MSNFKTGEKVVCLHGFKTTTYKIKYNLKYPIKGEIYTIREIDEDGYLRFEELINPKLNYSNGFSEAVFNPLKFRKLDTQFAEDLCKELIQQVKKESLILSN